MTFWYKFHYVMTMSFKSIHVLDGNVLELSHSLMGASGLWVFSEMPLQGRYIKSKVLNNLNKVNLSSLSLELKLDKLTLFKL